MGTTDLVAMHTVRPAGSHMQSIVPSAQPDADYSMKNWLILGAVVLGGLLIVGAIIVVVVLVVRKRQMDRRHRLINEGMDR